MEFVCSLRRLSGVELIGGYGPEAISAGTTNSKNSILFHSFPLVPLVWSFLCCNARRETSKRFTFSLLIKTNSISSIPFHLMKSNSPNQLIIKELKKRVRVEEVCCWLAVWRSAPIINNRVIKNMNLWMFLWSERWDKGPAGAQPNNTTKQFNFYF